MTDAVSAETTSTETTATTEAATATTTTAPATTTEVKLPIAQTTGETAETPAAITEVSYEPTGDPGLDVALSFVGKLGLAGDHPAMVNAGKGDFALLKATLATMGDKARGWEQMVALGEQAHARTAENAAKTAAAVTAAVHSVAGDEATWALVQAWAAQNADPAEKAEINKLFDSGVMGARAAAKLLVDAYRSATGTVVNPASATRSGASSTPNTSNGPLSARDYHAAVQELHSRLGNRMDASPEYAALKARLRR